MHFFLYLTTMYCHMVTSLGDCTLYRLGFIDWLSSRQWVDIVLCITTTSCGLLVPLYTPFLLQHALVLRVVSYNEYSFYLPKKNEIWRLLHVYRDTHGHTQQHNIYTYYTHSYIILYCWNLMGNDIPWSICLVEYLHKKWLCVRIHM